MLNGFFLLFVKGFWEHVGYYIYTHTLFNPEIRRIFVWWLRQWWRWYFATISLEVWKLWREMTDQPMPKFQAATGWFMIKVWIWKNKKDESLGIRTRNHWMVACEGFSKSPGLLLLTKKLKSEEIQICFYQENYLQGLWIFHCLYHPKKANVHGPYTSMLKKYDRNFGQWRIARKLSYKACNLLFLVVYIIHDKSI